MWSLDLRWSIRAGAASLDRHRETADQFGDFLQPVVVVLGHRAGKACDAFVVADGNERRPAHRRHAGQRLGGVDRDHGYHLIRDPDELNEAEVMPSDS
jgi:hypothetical protein